MDSTASPAGSPAVEYQARLQHFQAEGKALQRRHRWMGNARLLVFAAMMFLGVRNLWRDSPSLYWAGAFLVLFIWLVVLHRRILGAKNRAGRAVGFYQHGQARIEDRWAGQGDNGATLAIADHIYSDDLDILGDGSLFQLLCVARSTMGKQCLANWLLHPASLGEINLRQEAVRELATKVNLREDLALAGESEVIKADAAKLLRWVEASVDLDYRRWLPWTLACAALSVAALGFLFWTFLYQGVAFWSPFVFTLIINGSVIFLLRHRLETLFAGLDQASHNLDSLADLLLRLEAESFSSPRLQALQKTLFVNGHRASACIAKLDTITDLDESRHNTIVQMINLPLLYSVHVALGLQRWRTRYGAHVAQWLQTVGEVEALLSLAAYSYEHPEDPFPQLCAEGSPVMFRGQALGHPLLTAANCVRNDLEMGTKSQVILVSGSNMSGKSTLLRVVGTNTVLAMAGGTVRAHSLSLSPLAIGASMRISDSLQKGVSHFYAEIKRIRQVVDLSSGGSLLFLFDEILQGTNSHDRNIGAHGVLQTLLKNGALGLVTTHDLALTALAEQFPGKVLNVHFQEKLASGKLSFDYQLRQGVVTTSNGIELMRSIGLDV
jgi:hypothetical protein